MLVNQNKIDDKLYELQKVCNRYKTINSFADWVLFAIHKYISTGKATRQFEKDFIGYPNDKLLELVKKCLNGDLSDIGIIETTKKIISDESTILLGRNLLCGFGFVINVEARCGLHINVNVETHLK